MNNIYDRFNKKVSEQKSIAVVTLTQGQIFFGVKLGRGRFSIRSFLNSVFTFLAPAGTIRESQAGKTTLFSGFCVSSPPVWEQNKNKEESNGKPAVQNALVRH